MINAQTIPMSQLPNTQRSGGLIWCNECDARVMVLAVSANILNFAELKIEKCCVCGAKNIEFSPTLNKGMEVSS